jgi:uncharacterized protein (DUF433 family)
MRRTPFNNSKDVLFQSRLELIEAGSDSAARGNSQFCCHSRSACGAKQKPLAERGWRTDFTPASERLVPVGLLGPLKRFRRDGIEKKIHRPAVKRREGKGVSAMFDRITFDPQIMGGRACIRGMRISVSVIVGQIAHGATFEEILEGYPDLEREDIQAALEYAAWLTREEVYPVEAQK